MRSTFSIVAAATFALSALSFSANSAAESAVQVQEGDSCHLCGMVLVRYPGPKGVADLKTDQRLMFCSTRDLFEFVLQPDKGRHVVNAFVHDMGGNNWDQPSDKFIEAQEAWYVYGSDRPAAMGPALATFASEATAQSFADEFGGKLYRYDEITLEMLNSHRKGGMKHKGHGHHQKPAGHAAPAEQPAH